MTILCHSKHKVIHTHVEITSVKEQLSQPDWFQAMQLEYDEFLANHTWSLTTLSPHRKPVG